MEGLPDVALIITGSSSSRCCMTSGLLLHSYRLLMNLNFNIMVDRFVFFLIVFGTKKFSSSFYGKRKRNFNNQQKQLFKVNNRITT